MFRKPTEIVIITKDHEHFKSVRRRGGCGWFSKKMPCFVPFVDKIQIYQPIPISLHAIRHIRLFEFILLC
jgi:hypothetical protein